MIGIKLNLICYKINFDQVSLIFILKPVHCSRWRPQAGSDSRWVTNPRLEVVLALILNNIDEQLITESRRFTDKTTKDKFSLFSLLTILNSPQSVWILIDHE